VLTPSSRKSAALLTGGTSSVAKHATTYHDFSEMELSARKQDSPVDALNTHSHAHHVFHQHVTRAQRRDEQRKLLNDRRVGAEIYYPLRLQLQPCFAYLRYREGDLPESEHAASEVLALPMFPELTAEEQRWVVESIADFYS
jgi:dTDP-4-amino-4,6-dideoxygalactose transaminase